MDDNLELEMPLFSWGKKDSSDVNYKNKIEQKLLLARQDPEPIFDLADCNLTDVPSGVYSWCKVCIKQKLLLQNNRLKSISGGGNISDLFNLRLIELSHNSLSKIPEELCLLPNLQALYLHFNHLKTLPDNFNQLKSLQVLNLKSNCFKIFPPSICQLPRLEKLDISTNSIHRLPDSLVSLKQLNTLVFGEEFCEYPPPEICKNGLANIIQFLCQKMGKDYSTMLETECHFTLDSGIVSGDEVDSKSHPSSQQQEQLQQALMESEKNLQKLYERLSHTQATKQDFLKGLMEDQDRIDEELSNAQYKKDESHQKLLKELVEVEQESNYVIEELLELSRLTRTNDAILETLENDRKEFENLFMSVQNENSVLSRKEIVEAMENTLENQYREARSHLSAYNWAHKEMLAQTQLNDLTQALKLEEIMTKCGEDQASLISQLLQDEEYQKRAFAGLMMRKDEEYIRLADQIALIENELANLTLLELRRKHLKVQTEKDILENQRMILTDLFVQLVAQQDSRSKEFENRLCEMEAKRSMEQVDYWLRQYQRLLETKPDSLRQQEKLLHEDIKSILRKAGAGQFEMLFAKNYICLTEMCNMDDQSLQSLGVKESEIRAAILREVSIFKTESTNVGATNSGTKLQTIRPQLSFRARLEVECVVCMERMCTVLYVNCGHVCCCAQCAPTLKLCPLCRSPIAKIFLLTPAPSAPSIDT